MAQKRFFQTDYASGSRPGFCLSLESATMAAMKRILFDGFTSATISTIGGDQDVARLKMNDEKTRILITTTKAFEEHKEHDAWRKIKATNVVPLRQTDKDQSKLLQAFVKSLPKKKRSNSK